MRDENENGEQHTTVIMGGCNLAGCIMNHHTLGVIQWAKQLYQTEVYVPMCAEYEQPGNQRYSKDDESSRGCL